MASRKTLLLLGGGHSQVEVLRCFARKPPENTHLILVSREARSPYSGMLPGHIAGHYRREECHIDLAPLARAAGALFVEGTATHLNLEDKAITLANGDTLGFDLLSINTGSQPQTLDVPGAAVHAIPVKPVDILLARLDRTLLEMGTTERKLHVAVVGGGAGGVELILALNHRLERDYPVARESAMMHLHLITSSSEILPGYNDKARAAMENALERHNIHVQKGLKIDRVDNRFLRTEGDSALPYDVVFWATNAAPPAWIQPTGIETDASGFILVDQYLRSRSHGFVFAAGDVATIQEEPRPKSGVFAVRAGPFLAGNLRRTLNGTPLKPFTPQREFLTIISTGGKYAVASRGQRATEGRWVWRWKHYIDTRFMKRYRI